MTTGRTHKVLVIDDEPALVRALTINLRAHGWQVAVAASGEAGLREAAAFRPDVIVLDLGLPGISGMDVLARVRKVSRVPVLVLSARHLGQDKVAALDAGADDYVTKPFGMDELLARLRAAVRRTEPEQPAMADVVQAGDLTIDLGRATVLRDGAEVQLSPTEWALLAALVRSRGQLVDRLQLLHDVWGPMYTSETNYLRVYTAQLRRKLEKDPAHPRHIITAPGRGYRFEV